MGLTKYAEQILNIYNYFDGAIVADRRGIIEYYYNSRKDINTLNSKEILGRSLFEIYPGVDEKNSTMMEVVRTGKPLINSVQKLVNYKGESYEGIFSTFPVWDQNRIIGAVEIFLYMQNRDAHLNIFAINSEMMKAEQSKMMRNIISVSESMELFKRRISKASMTDSNVLLFGETGTGKELAAQAIHDMSRRGNLRFISQNCSAIPENLLESELFGYVEGAFTGAAKGGKMGFFEMAHKGTIFLDEIGDISPKLQSRLLRVLQEKEIIRLGNDTVIPIDVRVISATNKNLKEAVASGEFRQDLLYRLDVLELNLPPLRKRGADISLLLNHYIEFEHERTGCRLKYLNDRALRLLENYPWPGNIREMRNFCERLCILCQKDTADTDDIYRALPDIASPTLLQTEKQPEKSPTVSEEFPAYDEKAEILKALALFRNNRSRTAEYLNMHPSTLWRKMKKYGI